MILNLEKFKTSKNRRRKIIRKIKYKNKVTIKIKNNLLPKIISAIIVLILYIYLYSQINNIDYPNNCNNIEIKKKDANYTNNKVDKLLILTNNNEYIYQGMKNCLTGDPDEQLCIYHLLVPKKVVGKERILLGSKRDGCYVLLDDFKDIKIAYSFGIATMVQFDQALAERGIDVYMYDHTIKGLPYQNPKFHWKKIGIKGNNDNNPELKTLEELLKENGHEKENNMIFKIDTEGAEWNAISDLKDEILAQFKYIAIEYHFLEKDKGKLYHDVIKKISKTHQPFYLRCHGRDNINTFGNNRMCIYLEVSYVIKKDNVFERDDTIYPIFKFDFHGPSNNRKEEINLNLLKLFEDN